MVLSTPVFMFGFLVLTLLVYYAMPLKWRNAVLLCSSLFFYYWGEQAYTIIMIVSTLIDFSHGWLVDYFKKKNADGFAKLAVASSVFFNLSILFVFKYWDFFANFLRKIGGIHLPTLEVALPIGISFYTFQTMSYTIDVYRGDAKKQNNLVHFGTFVTLFPQLIAGPIIKYKDVGEQIDNRIHSVERFASGIFVFMIGLAKKLLLANNIGQLWESYEMVRPEEMSVGGAWLGILAFAFQIYFDFSGYSDMAVGLGRMFGFEFMENFHYPYISKSITEFWRRWHISLSTWFREYLYIPLGGNRCKKSRWIFNLLVVWAATGIWHGASWNYLLWGVFFFVVLVVEKIFLGNGLKKMPGFLQHIYTIILLLISWTVFAIEDISHLCSYLKVMLGLSGAPIWDDFGTYNVTNYGVVLMACILCSTPILKSRFQRFPKKLKMVFAVILLMVALLICTSYLVAGTYNPFLYFRF